MKNLVLSCSILLIYACGSVKPSAMVENKIVLEHQDTCFYEIIPAADMDMPQTPHWDTTITRLENYDVHCLKMRSWGTETQYTMSGPDEKNTVRRDCHFTHGSGSNLIDITDIPAGEYGFYLLSCGNGGGFTVHIK
jgi:hypothetical protein